MLPTLIIMVLGREVNINFKAYSTNDSMRTHAGNKLNKSNFIQVDFPEKYTVS
jgi:hypothetical protein